MRFVNLACGPIFIEDPNWVNLDFESTHPCVLSVDLLRRLPLGDSSCDVVYSSHFLEHIPRGRVRFLLDECYRVLKRGAAIRLVLPDFEAMCREYLLQRTSDNHRFADLMIVGIVDQCVRTVPGGELSELYKAAVSASGGSKGSELLQYIYERHGEDLLATDEMQSSKTSGSGSRGTQVGGSVSPQSGFIAKLQASFRHVTFKVRHAIFMLRLKALPNAFREQNVSLARIGERHHWLWDYYQLACELEKAGFTNITRVSHDSSNIYEFPLRELDGNLAGHPRKGRDSMYIEAMKQ